MFQEKISVFCQIFFCAAVENCKVDLALILLANFFMGTIFYVLVNLRTSKGFENFGRFELGSDTRFAYSVFNELEGEEDVHEEDSLTMELMEMKNSLPINLKMISCTLDELEKNLRHLTKEVFRKKNLAVQ